MASQTGQNLSYQRLLRAIGGHLDHDTPGCFRLLEMPDGFTVITEETSSWDVSGTSGRCAAQDTKIFFGLWGSSWTIPRREPCPWMSWQTDWS
jgi:hypothetical protein